MISRRRRVRRNGRTPLNLTVRHSSPITVMAVRDYHLKPLPDGVGIYAERLAVAGIHRRRAAAARFIRGSDLDLDLEPEPSNPHDRNALRVVGLWRGWFRQKRTFLGYVPRE